MLVERTLDKMKFFILTVEKNYHNNRAKEPKKYGEFIKRNMIQNIRIRLKIIMNDRNKHNLQDFNNTLLYMLILIQLELAQEDIHQFENYPKIQQDINNPYDKEERI